MLSAISIFNESFSNPHTANSVDESVLDYPNGKGLNPNIWNKHGNRWTLKGDLSKKVKEISSFVCKEMKLKDVSTFIVGSICTNSYGDDSDVDIHMELKDYEGKSEKFMRKLNKTAEKIFKEKYGDLKMDGRDVEIYLQNNHFQDEASRGCYDVYEDKWISGPQIKDSGFDPYEEYFEKSEKILDDNGILSKIGDVILKSGMYAFVLENLKDNSKFRSVILDKLNKASEDAKVLFSEIRVGRHVDSSPTNSKEAKSMREGEEWNTKDAAFKLLGNMGLIGIMKDLRNLDKEDDSNKSSYVLKTLNEKLFKVKNDD